LAANEKIAFKFQKKKFFTKLKTSQVCEFKTALRKFVKTEAFSIEFTFLGHVVLKLALQTMASILSNFFDESFMLLLTIAVFLLCCFLNKLQALFYRHFTNFIKDL
jgi:hypothetical protein